MAPAAPTPRLAPPTPRRAARLACTLPHTPHTPPCHVQVSHSRAVHSCRVECNVRRWHELLEPEDAPQPDMCPHMRRLWSQHLANRRHISGGGDARWALLEPTSSLEHEQEQQKVRERELALAHPVNADGRPMSAGQAASWALQRELREQEEAWRHLDSELEHTLNMAVMEQDTQERVMQRMEDLANGLGKEAGAQQPSRSAGDGGGGALPRSRKTSRTIGSGETVAAGTQKDLVDGAPIRHNELIISVKTASTDEVLEMMEAGAESTLGQTDDRHKATEALAAQADEMFSSMQARLAAVSVDATAQGLLKRNLSKQKHALQAQLDVAAAKLASSEVLEVARAEAMALLAEKLQAAEKAVEEALEQSRRAQEEGAMNALSLAAEQAADGPLSPGLSPAPSPAVPPTPAPQLQPAAEKKLDAKEERQLDAALAAPFARKKIDISAKVKTAAAGATGAAGAKPAGAGAKPAGAKAKAAAPLARQATLVCSDMGTQTEAADGPAGPGAGKAGKDAKGKKGVAALSAAASSGPLPSDAQQLVKLIPGGLLEQLRHLPKSLEGRVMARGLAAPLLWQLLDSWSERHTLSMRQKLQPPTFAEHVYDSYLMKYGMHSLADERVVELVSTLRAHRNGLVRADLMGRLLGMWDAIPTHGTDFFLAAFSAVSFASKEKGIHPSPPPSGAGTAGAAKGGKGGKGGAPPEDAKERGAAYCSLEVAREMLPTLLHLSLEADAQGLLAKLEGTALPAAIKQANLETVSIERVDFDMLLSGMMQLWSKHDQAQHDEQRSKLRAVFETRFKPDQPVAFADFEQIVKEVGGGEVERHRALVLYHRAVDTSRARGGADDSISAAVFSEVLAPVGRMKLRRSIADAIRMTRLARALGRTLDPEAQPQEEDELGTATE